MTESATCNNARVHSGITRVAFLDNVRLLDGVRLLSGDRVSGTPHAGPTGQATFEKGRRHERDRLAAHLEEPDDVVRGAITQPNPDHLRWRPEQDTQPVKVLVLGHDDESVIASIGPDCTVRGGGRPTSLTWTEPGYRSASASTRRAARFSSKSSLGGCSGSRTTGVGIPRAFAVLRLTVKSTFVGCSTGRSPGFAPLKILSTWVALCGRGPKTSAPYWRSPPLILLSCAERVVRCPLAAVRRRSVRHLHVPSLPALISTIVPSGRTYWLPGAHGTDKGQPGELWQADLLSEFVGVDRA